MHRYIGHHTAEKLGQLAGLPPEEREVVAYGIEYLLSSLLGLSLILLTGFVLGLFLETLAVLCCWGLLRLFAGGAHCTALWRCTMANLVGILAAILAAKAALLLVTPVIWIAICTAWALLAVWLWAPNNSERPMQDPKKRRRLRKLALLLVLFIGSALLFPTFSGADQLQFLSVAGATGLAAGALMISPPGFQLIKKFDQRLQDLHSMLNSTDKGCETR